MSLRELREAAYHEAGYHSMYRRFGGIGKAVVLRNKNRTQDEKAWGGHFKAFACPEARRDEALREGVVLLELPKNWRALWGISGLVAEEIMHGETAPEYIGSAINIKIACGQTSASDLKEMGITDVLEFSLDEELIEQAWRFLLEDWQEIHREAEWLIEYDSAAVIDECAEQLTR